MKQSILVIVKCALVIIPFVYVSASAQSTLYRVDRRPPAEIFENGFESWGDNFSVSQHIENGPRFIESGFISSSDKYDIPLKLNSIWNEAGIPSYIYSFDVPPNTFDSYDSYRNVLGKDAADAIKEKTLSTSGRSEILTVKRVPKEYIRKAFYFQKGKRNHLSETNINYNPDAAQYDIIDNAVVPDAYISPGTVVTEEEVIGALEAVKAEQEEFNAASAGACVLP